MKSWQDVLLSWSPEKAWFLGVVYGDGNVYRTTHDNRVTVVGCLSTTTRWLRLISETKEPKPIKHSPGTMQAYYDSKDLVEWFIQTYGMCGPKCTTLVWPEDLPQELKVHFLRGLWDTDGSLSIYDRRAHGKKGNPEFKSRFGCMAVEFVRRVRTELELLLPGLPHVVDSWDHGTQRISYGSATAFRVAEFLYAGAPEHIRNDERYKVYQRMTGLKDLVDNTCCPCGKPATHEGRCQACWWANHGRTTGPGTICACGKPVHGRGLCTACYNRERRARSDYQRKSTGTCKCGKPAYRRAMCDACYSRLRRAEISCT